MHIERQLVQRLGREPRPDEIAEELEMTTEEVREILRMAQHPISLEKPIGEEEDSELGDFVEDDQAESPFDSASLTLRSDPAMAACAGLALLGAVAGLVIPGRRQAPASTVPVQIHAPKIEIRR